MRSSAIWGKWPMRRRMKARIEREGVVGEERRTSRTREEVADRVRGRRVSKGREVRLFQRR
jgi:hypothetical protein